MAIDSSAQFDYLATLRHDSDRVWRGRATGTPDRPQLVGTQPAVELTAGVLTLTDDTTGAAVRSITNPRPSKIAGATALQVGEAPEALIQDGDQIRLNRDGMGTLALIVAREGRLILGLGAVAHSLAEFGVSVDIDPRADEVRFYYMKSLLDQPDAVLVWLDPVSPDYSSQLAELDHIPAHITMVSIAARCADWSEAVAVNDRAVGGRRTRWGFNYELVAERFQTREQFVGYLRALPERHRGEFFLRFRDGGRHVDVREGECTLLDPWLLCVDEVEMGSAWTASRIGIGRTQSNLSPDALRESVRKFTQWNMRIGRG